MKINSTNFQEKLSFPPPNYTLVHSLKWSHATGTNYHINGYVTNANDTNLGMVKNLFIDLGNNIEEGQIITVSTSGFDFSLDGDFLNPMDYTFVSGTTTGQIKITHFDGVKLSAEFAFNSLKSNNYSDPISYENTVTGTITLIEKED